MSDLPNWASEVISGYESGVAGCFLLHGNTGDRLLMPGGENFPEGEQLGSLRDFLGEVLLPRFEIVLTYDLGEGLRVQRGDEKFEEWAGDREVPSQPLATMRYVGKFLRYQRNTRALTGKSPRVAFVVREAHLVCPSLPNALNYELNALASLLRGWATGGLLQENDQAVFLVADRSANLHPLLLRETSIRVLEIPLPDGDEVGRALAALQPEAPIALKNFEGRLPELGMALRGTTLGSVETLVRRRQFDGLALEEEDVGRLKRELVEKDCEGLIEFIEPDRDLSKVIGLEAAKAWLRDDLALWRRGELEAMPMGYLFCGPVGTGKTYLAECLAGEAGVPMVVLRNFRDKWVGSTEANLEKIFALLHALGRCLVFVDEADQALGKREGGSGDSGVSSRVYSMMAAEMSDTRNRGKIVWVLASSRPDLIEVDLKRPGRVDVKIPLFPSTNPAEGFALLRALCGSRGVKIEKDTFPSLEPIIPNLLTPGAAEAIAVKVFRGVKAKSLAPDEALRGALTGYLPPIDPEILRHQMNLAAAESTEPSFLDAEVRALLGLD
ncbi:AAA family ATPase [Roseibacillus persicicus]|uniref:AAA family ATPase n=1 Tax=Roseibacillus persicicus TaxID=454148 RepID=UPI0028105EE7|nr:AAA family ATPase [Roseibacillus persicicus]MDQ8190290.1 AAA family ATPase [Roseibacillus persicicus]